MPLTSILPGFLLSYFVTIQRPSSIPFTLHLVVVFYYMASGMAGKYEKILEIQQNERQRSQCNQTIVCCELPVFAPARTSGALLLGRAVRDENAAAKHQVYTV